MYRKFFDSAQQACDAIGAVLDRPLPAPGKHIRLKHFDSRTNNRSIYLNVNPDGDGGCVYSFRTNEIIFWSSKNKLDQTKKVLKKTANKSYPKSNESNEALVKKLLAAATKIKKHPYLQRKYLTKFAQYPLYEINRKEIEKVYREILFKYFSGDRFILVPLQDINGNFQTAQLINEGGEKRFLKGSIKNYFFITQSIQTSKIIGIAEGVATALSVTQVKKIPVVAAMSCNQFKRIVPLIKKSFPDASLIVLADKGNGEQEARKVALENGVRFAVPDFSEISEKRIAQFFDLEEQPNDFNDYFILEGKLL